MEDEGGVLVRLTVPCDAKAPGTVREAMSEVGSQSAFGDAMLVASELVTNAVQHSGGREDDLLYVKVHRDRDDLVISVRDPGASGKTAQTVQQGVVFGGIGLKIVELLTSEWGQQREDGYMVWAKLPACFGEARTG